VIKPGVVPPVPEPGVRRWQRRGIKHAVNRYTVSGTWCDRRGMVGKDKGTEASELRIVTRAGLEPPFGPSAKTAWRAGR